MALRLLSIPRMIGVAYAILGLFAAGILTELVTAMAAPMGYQDESGFHLDAGEDRRA
jgi:hypothetical protein